MQTRASGTVELDPYFSNIGLERHASETEFVVKHHLSRRDFAGLPVDLASGTIVISDKVRPDGTLRCRLSRADEQSFALPPELLTPYVRTWEQTCYMPHDPQL